MSSYEVYKKTGVLIAPRCAGGKAYAQEVMRRIHEAKPSNEEEYERVVGDSSRREFIELIVEEMEPDLLEGIEAWKKQWFAPK